MNSIESAAHDECIERCLKLMYKKLYDFVSLTDDDKTTAITIITHAQLRIESRRSFVAVKVLDYWIPNDFDMSPPDGFMSIGFSIISTDSVKRPITVNVYHVNGKLIQRVQMQTDTIHMGIYNGHFILNDVDEFILRVDAADRSSVQCVQMIYYMFPMVGYKFDVGEWLYGFSILCVDDDHVVRTYYNIDISDVHTNNIWLLNTPSPDVMSKIHGIALSPTLNRILECRGLLPDPFTRNPEKNQALLFDRPHGFATLSFQCAGHRCDEWPAETIRDELIAKWASLQKTQ